MTYCLAISVNAGMVFCSDSRTNAGVDQISTYSKMHRFACDGERALVLLTSGNLATSQAVVARIEDDIHKRAKVNLYTVGTVHEAADYVGRVAVEQQAKHSSADKSFEVSFILGGQIVGAPPQATLIYPQGNHISASRSTPYLQIGESKYGKPILDRILTLDTTLDTAALCALVSMDSTMRSNLTVGPPIEALIYEAGSLAFSKERYHCFTEDSEFLRELKRSWDARLHEAFSRLPPLAWSFTWDRKSGERNEAC